MSTTIQCVLFLVCLPTPQAKSPEARFPVQPGDVVVATDTLNVGNDPSPKVRDVLNSLKWKREKFNVRFETSKEPGSLLVRFPTSVKSENATNNSVAMEWYPARDSDDQIISEKTPAVVVVHESGRQMAVGRIFAKQFSRRGIHAFMIQLPWYGVRLESGIKRNDLIALQSFPQAIADVRRARDAVAALPGIDSSRIALQGTSLGAIVSASAGALDDGFDSVFLVLAGGDLVGILKNGRNESAQVRRILKKAGVTNDTISKWSANIEPLRLAHRLNPQRTWMFNGAYDKVIPKANSDALAKAIGLNREHHVVMPTNHYSGIFLMPVISKQIAELIPQTSRRQQSLSREVAPADK